MWRDVSLFRYLLFLFFFFFSSRRRHTRYWRDSSSDVCYSDLRALEVAEVTSALARVIRLQRGGQLVDQAGLLADVPLTVFGEELELLGRFRTRLQRAQV